VTPPAWTPNAYYRLSFTHQHPEGDVVGTGVRLCEHAQAHLQCNRSLCLHSSTPGTGALGVLDP